MTEALEDNKPNKEGAETEKSTSKDDSDEPTEDKTAEAKKEPSDAVEPYDLEVRFIGPEPTVSPEVSNAEGEELSKGKILQSQISKRRLLQSLRLQRSQDLPSHSSSRSSAAMLTSTS